MKIAVAITITKINRRSGEVHSTNLYPNVPWVGEALRRRLVLQAELKEISKSLDPLKISKSAHWGSIQVEDYATYATHFSETIKTKADKAREVMAASLQVAEL